MKKIVPMVCDGEKPPMGFLKKDVVFLPFYSFRALYSSGAELFFLVDALKGKVLRVNGDLLKKGEEVSGVFPHGIKPQEARAIILPEARFPMGVFKRIRMEELHYEGRVLYPFLVYYTKKGKGYDLRVFDAVTGKNENMLAKELVIEFLIRKRRRV